MENFGTRGHHFFDEGGALYQALSRLIDLRKKLIPLRRGRQMLHEISGDGIHFGLPRMMGEKMLSVVAWSRIFVDQEVLVALNTDSRDTLTVYSTVASRFRSAGDRLKLTFWHAPRAAALPPDGLTVEDHGGTLAVSLTLPPAGFVIYLAPAGRQNLSSRRALEDQLQQA